MRDIHSISELCEALGVSRSGYHAARKRPSGTRACENLELLIQMRTIHAHRHTRCYGSPRMTHTLNAMGLPCSENRVARLMRSVGLRARPRRPFRPRTTRTDNRACPSPNHLKDAGPPAGPGRQIVSDITYIPTGEGWLYLATVMDLHSRRILGWKLAQSMHADLVTGTIEASLRTGLPREGTLFHSDRGSQYTATATRALLARHGILQSMSAKGDCYDNALRREPLRHPQERAHAPRSPLRHQSPGRDRDLRLHRDVLQPHPTPQRPRLHVSRRLPQTTLCKPTNPTKLNPETPFPAVHFFGGSPSTYFPTRTVHRETVVKLLP